MQPIGPLMHEHRLIDRMVELIHRQSADIGQGRDPDTGFIAGAVEFFQVYADQCHHGKEEDLLFKELRNKVLSDDLSTIMTELIEEHRQGRRMVRNLNKANQAYRETGRGVQAIRGILIDLADFYPRHIAKEDKRFFFPIMECFDRSEMDRMLAEFHEFDQRLIHEFFGTRVRAWE